MTWIFYRGIEAVRAHPAIPTHLRSRDPCAVRRGSPSSRCTNGQSPAQTIHPELSWFSPFSLGVRADGVGVAARHLHLLGLGLGVAVNEESENREEGPGRAAVVSTVLLL